VISYSLTNFMTNGLDIQRNYLLPHHSRYAINTNGDVYLVGGYDSQLNTFSKDFYVLDEYRQDLNPLGKLFKERAEHACHFFKGNLFVFGGMAFREEDKGGKPFLESLNSCEFYSFQRNMWVMLPSFSKPRQNFSVCQFNNKYIFIIGGKNLLPEATIQTKPFEFVEEVEAFDIELNSWRTVNYIKDNHLLRIINPCAMQV
jgi:hypothetical protein